MESKLTYYDVVAHLVPGTLVLSVLALMPHVFGFTLPWHASDAVGIAIGVPLAYTVGQVVQAASSLIQPFYYRLWGGMPSTVILDGRSPRLGGDRLARIIAALGTYFDTPVTTLDQREAIFSDAMALCARGELGRTSSFNASYAFHRALLTTGLVAAVLLGGAVTLSYLSFSEPAGQYHAGLWYLFVLAAVMAALEFVRARQRGEYFSVEVLNMAYLHARDASAGTK
jgi:hypothetical protein